MERTPQQRGETIRAYIARLEAETRRQRMALEIIRRTHGRVCPMFTECDHASCNSSAGSWLIADMALSGTADDEIAKHHAATEPRRVETYKPKVQPGRRRRRIRDAVSGRRSAKP